GLLDNLQFLPRGGFAQVAGRPDHLSKLEIEGDIENCFGTIHQGTLMRQLQRRILDKRLLALIWEMLRAGVMEDLQYAETNEGVPQGGPLSPLLANVYMHRLDEWMHQRFHAIPNDERYRRRLKGEFVSVRYIRYADDFIVLVRDGEGADGLKRELAEFIRQELKMTLSEEKTTIVHASQGFDFLGERVFIAPRRSNPDSILPYQIPSQKSVEAYRRKVRELTHHNLDYISPGDRIRALNRLIEGWANYHHWGNAKETFSTLGFWTVKKVHAMLRRTTSVGKKATYRMFFRPISECANLKRWNKYTNWLTPSVKVDGDIWLGLLPMSVVSTKDYWKYRGNRIPPAYKLLSDETGWNERDAEFPTDVEVIELTVVDQMSQRDTGKYGLGYFLNRREALQRDRYTCTVCGYRSQRRRGDVNDLEVHHIDPQGGHGLDNLQTVCRPCHNRLRTIEQAD
ncbi:MAG: HNH endonuclease, partial [Anaerolineae bacterium]|nr:HNH endonuclease [Anaerolineae bacterium]